MHNINTYIGRQVLPDTYTPDDEQGVIDDVLRRMEQDLN